MLIRNLAKEEKAYDDEVEKSFELQDQVNGSIPVECQNLMKMKSHQITGTNC